MNQDLLQQSRQAFDPVIAPLKSHFIGNRNYNQAPQLRDISYKNIKVINIFKIANAKS